LVAIADGVYAEHFILNEEELAPTLLVVMLREAVATLAGALDLRKLLVLF